MTNYLPAWPWIFQEFSKFLLAYGDVAVLPLRLFERCITPGFLSLALRVPAVIVVGVGLTIAEFIQEAVHVIQIVVPACILVPVWPLFVPWLTRHTFRRVVEFAAVFLTVTNLASEAFACKENEVVKLEVRCRKRVWKRPFLNMVYAKTMYRKYKVLTTLLICP